LFAVSKIIEFLEKWGQDADLRHASNAELNVALMHADIDDSARAVVLQKDQRLLEELLDAGANVCCMIATPMEEDDDEEEAEEKKEVEADKNDKASGVKSHDFPARRAA
jgi:hypothetical protein